MLRFMVVIVGVSFGPASLWSGEILLVTASSDTERIDALVRAIDSQGHQASLALSGLKVVPPQFDSDVFA